MTLQFCIIGHRGAAALAPENTLPSFARAIEENVNGIELDLHYVDGRLVVIHDDTVDRTSNGSGELQQFSFNELRELDFGDGAKIPTLEEVIEATPTNVLLNIELKGPNTGKSVAQILPNYPRYQYIVSSFRCTELSEFSMEYSPSSNLAIALLGVRLSNRLMDQANQIGAKILHVSARFLQKKIVYNAIQNGFRIYVYTVNDLKRAIQLRDLGIEGIFTDNPQMVQFLT